MISPNQYKLLTLKNFVSLIFFTAGAFIMTDIWLPNNFLAGFILTSVFLMFLPGYFLWRILLGETDQDIPEKIAVWFIFSLTIVMLPVLLGYFFKLKLSHVSGLIILSTFIFFMGALLYEKKRIEKVNSSEKEITSTKEQIFIWGAIALALFFTVIIFKIGGDLGEDTPIHLAMIRKLLERGRIDTTDIYFKGFGEDLGYIYSLWQPVLALLAWAIKAEPMVIWHSVPFILTPVLIFSFYSVAKRMFDSKKVGFVTISVLVYVLGGIRYNDVGFAELNTPYAVAKFIILPMTIYFLFRYLRDKKNVFLIFSAISSLILATIHLFHWLLYIISLFSFLLFTLLLKRKDRAVCKSICMVLFLTIILVAPYLSLRSLNYQIVNPVKVSPEEVNVMPYLHGCMVKISDTLYYIHPKYALRMIYILFYEFSFLPVIALLCIPILLPYRQENSVVFLLSQLCICPLILLNPFLVPVLTKIITLQYSAIMGQMIPGFLVAGFVLATIPGVLTSSAINTWRIERMRNHLMFILILLFSLFFLPSVSQGFGNIARRVKTAQDIDALTNRAPVYVFLDKLEPSVILSDIANSTLIVQYTKHYVVAMEPAWAPASDDEAIERVKDVKTVLDGGSEISLIKPILKRREVDYILLTPDYCTLSLYKKFEKIGLEKIFDKNGYVVYKVR